MIELEVNGTARQVEAPADMPLLWVLRDMLGLTGTKFGCGIAQCGACTVHLDGQAVRSCHPTPPVRSAASHDDRGLGKPEASRAGAWIETRSRSAATANRARSWRPLRCSRAIRTRATTRSTLRWPETCAVAGPIRESAARSTAPPARLRQTNAETNNRADPLTRRTFMIDVRRRGRHDPRAYTARAAAHRSRSGRLAEGTEITSLDDHADGSHDRAAHRARPGHHLEARC